MLKFLEPLAAEHGMIFTLQKGHLVWFHGVVGGGLCMYVSFLIVTSWTFKKSSFSGELPFPKFFSGGWTLDWTSFRRDES